MQPMYRPPMPPPQGMRPPNIPPECPPSGLVPQQRPPAGYKPTIPPGYTLSNPPTMPQPMMNLPTNPPVQKMAELNLESSAITPQQSLSNGIPDNSNSSSSQPATNSDQNISNSNRPNSHDHSHETISSQSSGLPPTNNAASSEALQKKFQRESPQGESFPIGLGATSGGTPVSEINSSFSLGSSLNENSASHITTHSANTSFGSSVSSGRPPTHYSQAASAMGAINRPISPHQPTAPSSQIPLQPSMQSPKLNLSPPISNLGPTRPTVPTCSTGSPAATPVFSPSTPGAPFNPMMTPHSIGSHPGAMPPASTGAMIPPSSISGPPLAGGPPRPMMPPTSAGIPPRYMMPPTSSFGGMPPPPTSSFSGMPPPPPTSTFSGMPPPPPTSSFSGMPPPPPTSSFSGMPPPPPTSSFSGMPPPPTSSFGGTQPPAPSFMGPPRPAGNAAFPPHMIGHQPSGHPPRPGMLPPPTNSFMPSHNASMSPPSSATHPPPVAQSGMPPVPEGMAPPAPSALGSMQNRYPGSSPGGGGPMGNYPQGAQGRRLNPDDMPSPLQVIQEDKNCKSGEFVTNMKGSVPPLVTTDFVVKDGGNASPRYIRSTMYSVPATPDIMKQASVPFGLVICPYADPNLGEAPLYLGTSLTNGPVRCNRCKAYMSPFMIFMDGGRRFQCLLCKQINEVPPEYYCHMDSQGCRADKYQRPELCLGTYEFVATPEYCKDKLLPKEPAFIFVLEMNQMMVQRGIINFLCQNMKDLLEHLPKDEIPGQEGKKSSVHVGFITYDTSVHFYKLTGLAPEMCIVCDKETMFVPVPDGVLCDVEEVSDNIDKLMESIPQNFQTTRETSGALSCAIQAGMSALKASGRAGKLFVFHSSLCQIEGQGKLRNREDRKVLGTEKEKSVLSPQTQHYNNLGQELVVSGCSVDLYLFNESYVDLATIGQVSRLTGGQCHKYTFFHPNKDGERLLDDLKINISRNIAFDSVMRVRTSTGVRPVEFYGHFFMSNTQDIELAAVDSNKAVAVEIKHDDKITEEDGVYIQVALLFTSSAGQRRLRIINLALNICTQMADLYKNCELDTLMNFFGKQSMFKFLDSSAKQVKDNLIARTAQILACYRKNCASPSSAGQLILPELMKLLPLYVNCLTKCDALSGGQDLTCDDRSWHIYQLTTMPVEASVVYYYPRLIPLLDDEQLDGDIPFPVRTSYEKLSPDGAYILENGLFMFMWVGSGTSSTWMKDVFGVSAPHQLDPVMAELPDFENAASQRVRNIVGAIREGRKLHLRLFVVPQQGKHEVVMRNYLIEDKGMFGAPSYVDFLCHVHKEIRALLS